MYSLIENGYSFIYPLTMIIAQGVQIGMLYLQGIKGSRFMAP